MTLTVVAVVFGVFAVGLIVLLIYKSTLTMHEDDQLFLDDHNSHMQEEQTELLTKVNRLVDSGSGLQHRFGSISAGAGGDADLPEAERSAVASFAGSRAVGRLLECSARQPQGSVVVAAFSCRAMHYEEFRCHTSWSEPRARVHSTSPIAGSHEHCPALFLSKKVVKCDRKRQ